MKREKNCPGLASPPRWAETIRNRFDFECESLQKIAKHDCKAAPALRGVDVIEVISSVIRSPKVDNDFSVRDLLVGTIPNPPPKPPKLNYPSGAHRSFPKCLFAKQYTMTISGEKCMTSPCPITDRSSPRFPVVTKSLHVQLPN